MSKNCSLRSHARLTKDQMTDAAYIDDAANWSRQLAQMKSRGPGDLENAMIQIEREYGIDYWTQWTLRYRKNRFKDIGIGLYHRIRDAYRTECERQMRKLSHELSITKALAGAGHASVAAAEAVVHAAHPPEGEGE